MYFLTNLSVMLMLLGQGPHFEWPCFVVFRNHSSLEFGSEHVPSTVREWMNGVLNQSVLAECPALEGPTEKPPTNHKASNNTVNIGEELVQSSLKHKGKGVNSALVGGGCEWGAGSHKGSALQHRNKGKETGQGSRNLNPGGASGV